MDGFGGALHLHALNGLKQKEHCVVVLKEMINLVIDSIMMALLLLSLSLHPSSLPLCVLLLLLPPPTRHSLGPPVQ